MTWLTINDEGLVRVFIVGLVLMVCCASLLGVMLGWKLRDREVKSLMRKVAVLRLQLGKMQAKEIKSLYGGGFKLPGRTHYEGCGAEYIGPIEGLSWMRCSRPAGHDRGSNRTKHGYAGVFWGPGVKGINYTEGTEDGPGAGRSAN